MSLKKSVTVEPNGIDIPGTAWGLSLTLSLSGPYAIQRDPSRPSLGGRLSVRTVLSMLDSQDSRSNGDFFDLTTHHDERLAAHAVSEHGLEDAVAARAARSAAHDAADDALDRRGKDVAAADDEHVVEPAEDATLQVPERPPARAWCRGEARTVAGTETDHGRADAPEVGEDELAVARGPSGRRVDDLDDELGLADVEPRLLDAFVAVGADLGHARMIVRPRAPPRLDARSYRRDAGARLACVDGEPHASLRQVLAALARHLDQVERVGRRAHEHSRAERLHPGQS